MTDATAPASPMRSPSAAPWRLSSGTAFSFGLGLALALMLVRIATHDGVAIAGGQVENGVVQGAIYALIAIGYTMVYGIIELINFAHGDVFTLSGFYAILAGGDLTKRLHDQVSAVPTYNLAGLATQHGLIGFLAALVILLPLTMVMAGITGVLIERVAYRRLRNSPRLAPLITAVGMSFLIEGLMLAQAGGSNVPAESANWVTGTAATIGSVAISWAGVTVVLVALILMYALSSFVRYSRLGKAMRATAQDRDAALICGIDINRTISLTFFIGSALAAAGSVMYGIYIKQINWQDGFRIGIIAFTAAVLGGIGNIIGAGLGGFLIGIFSVLGGQVFNAEWSNSIVFVMLIVVLTVRPTGLLGMRVPDRA